MPRSAVHIVGIGSPYGADNLAWQFIEYLQESTFPQRQGAHRTTLTCCASPAQLPGGVDADAALVVIDALQGVDFGELLRIDGRDLESVRTATSSHGVDLVEMVGLIEQLYPAVPEIAVLGIGIGNGETRILAEDKLCKLAACLRGELAGLENNTTANALTR